MFRGNQQGSEASWGRWESFAFLPTPKHPGEASRWGWGSEASLPPNPLGKSAAQPSPSPHLRWGLGFAQGVGERSSPPAPGGAHQASLLLPGFMGALLPKGEARGFTGAELPKGSSNTSLAKSSVRKLALLKVLLSLLKAYIVN